METTTSTINAPIGGAGETWETGKKPGDMTIPGTIPGSSPLSSQTQMMPTIPTQAPTTTTSGLAESDLATKKKFLEDMKAGMSAQQLKIEAANLPEGTDTESIQKVLDEMQRREDEANKTAEPPIDESTGLPKTPEQIQAEKDLVAAQTQMDETNASIIETLEEFSNGTHPLTTEQQAQVDALRNEFNSLINEQQITNENFTKGTELLGFRTGQANYMPAVAAGNIKSAIDQGLSKIADLNAKMSSAIAQMESGFQSDNFEMVTKSYEVISDIQKQKTDALQKTIDDARASQKELRDYNRNVANDIYEQVTKPIQDIAATAAQSGAPQSILNAISGAKDVNSAIAAAGGYLQTGTGDVGDFLFYKRDMESRGLTSLDFTSWKAKQDAEALKQKSATAYAEAYASASGKAAAEAENEPVEPTEVNPDSKSILAQTGLSKLEFDYLTMGTKALTRLTEKERLNVISTVGNWLNEHNIDSSTFIAQYDAYNKTLENNIKRVNQVKVAEGELKGTLDNLKTAADDSSFNSMRWANIAKLFAGQEFNDPNVSKYAFHLQQLRSEMAMYNAAAAGKIDSNGSIQTDDSDFKEAERIIKDGFAAKSIDGFQSALIASVGKMDVVLNSSVNNSRKNVWDLFGVGENFKPEELKMSEEQAKQKVDNYFTDNPDKIDTVNSLYEVPGTNDSDVLEYMKLHPEIYGEIK